MEEEEEEEEQQEEEEEEEEEQQSEMGMNVRMVLQRNWKRRQIS